MRKASLLLSATLFAVLATSAAEARPAFGAFGHRVGGDTTASEKATDGAALIETVAAFLGFTISAKVTPITGSDAPRSAQTRAEQCEEEKKRADAAKAAERQRTADSSKPQPRGSEPLYLAF